MTDRSPGDGECSSLSTSWFQAMRVGAHNFVDPLDERAATAEGVSVSWSYARVCRYSLIRCSLPLREGAPREFVRRSDVQSRFTIASTPVLCNWVVHTGHKTAESSNVRQLLPRLVGHASRTPPEWRAGVSTSGGTTRLGRLSDVASNEVLWPDIATRSATTTGSGIPKLELG
jgi:hypothetical protein